MRSKEAEKRRASRTERRRVMLKERKAEQRARRQHVSQAHQGESEGMRLGDRVLALVPESLREAAIERCIRRAQAAETVRGLPPGFELQRTPHGMWQVVPPAEHSKSLLIQGVTHALPELAAAFAWEVAEGQVDVEATREVASQIIANMIQSGVMPSGGPENDEMTIKIAGLLLAGELLTGYQSTAMKYGAAAPT
jgi:hypothetical protein